MCFMVCPLSYNELIQLTEILLDKNAYVWNHEEVGAHGAGLSSYDNEQGDTSGMVSNNPLLSPPAG